LPKRRATTCQEELPLGEPAPAWRARGIFTDRIIKTKLSESRLWPAPETVEAVRAFCADLWNRKHVWLGRKGLESHTRQELLDPVLQRSGFAFLPGTDLPSSSKRREPDYLLYPDEQTKSELFAGASPDPYPAAIALLEAKKVNHPLDAPSKSETPGRFPHQQVREYLQYAIDQTGKPYFNWAILANGNLWRLYCRNASPDDYFEFNFEKSLGSPEDFAVFVALFNPAAFVPNTEGVCPLDELRADAIQYQTKLEDDLRERVFAILENLANGFYSRSENAIAEADLPDLYENCLILLYRLLFVLYAEGKGLLPVRPYGAGANRNYRERYSLQRLLPKLREPSRYFGDDAFTDLYDGLLGLFRLINGDDSSLNRKCNVYQYNGGLFDPKRYPKLRRWRVGEKTLADVLQSLMFGRFRTRRGEPSRFDFGETIDYAELEVRQLGSIYEGLLENHLELKDGRLLLVGDKAERKATGTYYTPDFVARYIVEHTLGPLCKRIDDSTPVREAVKQEKKDDSFANAVLELKVLDPAMGSGHFLVRATEYLADRILNHPTTSLQVKKVSPGLSHAQAEIAFWRRRVVERCVFGVDLNPLAVELSKLSLWLTCIATDQPLSFLDHHLRPGNSLIGARLSDLESLPGKVKIAGETLKFGPDLQTAVSQAIAGLNSIEQAESSSIVAVKEKEALWAKKVRPGLESYRTVADLWTSVFFGSHLDDTKYWRLASLLLADPDPKRRLAARDRELLGSQLTALREVRERYAFFHWELEFPEVFFKADGKPKGDGGFDAVIGNPPYVRPHKLDPVDKTYFWRHYETFVKKSDLYCCFMERSIHLLRTGGLFGYIVSDGWLRLDSFEKMRTFLLQETALQAVIDFTGNVFEDANVNTVVLLLSKDRVSTGRVRICVTGPTPRLGELTFKTIAQELFTHTYKHILDLSLDPRQDQVKRKMRHGSTPLGELFSLSFGLKTGDDSVFLSFKATTRDHKHLLRGEDVHRYSARHKGEFVWYVPNKMTEHRRTARPGSPERFEQPKVLMRDTGGNLEGSFDEAKYYVKDVLVVTDHRQSRASLLYLLGVLNSKLMRFYYETSFPTLHVQRDELASLPIRSVAGSEAGRARHDKMVSLVERMLKSHKDLQAAWAESDKDAIKRNIEETDKEIDALVYELYGLTPEEIAIVEGTAKR
jgi:hypothetical protein